MKTSVMEVNDMLSVLSVADVENRIEAVPGVESATVNFAARNVTVRFDETRLEIADIRASVRQAGFVQASGKSPMEPHAAHAPKLAATQDLDQQAKALPPVPPQTAAGAEPLSEASASAPKPAEKIPLPGAPNGKPEAIPDAKAEVKTDEKDAATHVHEA